MSPYTWRQILSKFFKIVENPGSFLKLFGHNRDAFSFNWGMSSKIVNDGSKIIQDGVQLKPKAVGSLLLTSEGVLPSENYVDPPIPKSEFLLKEGDANIVINEHCVVFLEEYGVIIRRQQRYLISQLL